MSLQRVHEMGVLVDVVHRQGCEVDPLPQLFAHEIELYGVLDFGLGEVFGTDAAGWVVFGGAIGGQAGGTWHDYLPFLLPGAPAGITAFTGYNVTNNVVAAANTDTMNLTASANLTASPTEEDVQV